MLYSKNILNPSILDVQKTHETTENLPVCWGMHLIQSPWTGAEKQCNAMKKELPLSVRKKPIVMPGRGSPAGDQGLLMPGSFLNPK